MDLRQLEYLLTVVEEANVTRAAHRLHVAQPGVSAAIRRLERELGQDLLDRSGRTVRPTECGQAVLPHARAAMQAVAAARSAVEELAGLVRGRVHIGTITSINPADIDLAGMLAAFHDQYPAVEIALSTAGSDQLIDGVRTGWVDLAVVGLGTAAPPNDLGTHVLTAEPLVAAVAVDHRLAATASITVRALSRHPLISLPPGTGLRACLEQACAAAGVRAQVRFEAGDPRVLAELAERGLGVALVPRSITAARPDTLHALTVRPRLQPRLALAWRTTGAVSPAARRIVEHARRHLSPV